MNIEDAPRTATEAKRLRREIASLAGGSTAGKLVALVLGTDHAEVAANVDKRKNIRNIISSSVDQRKRGGGGGVMISGKRLYDRINVELSNVRELSFYSLYDTYRERERVFRSDFTFYVADVLEAFFSLYMRWNIGIRASERASEQRERANHACTRALFAD